MDSNRSIEQQLVLKELELLPGEEWIPRVPGWCLVRVSRGGGYWLQEGLAQELSAGWMLVLPERTRGFIRSSQLCEMALQAFRVQLERLSAVLTLGEQKALQEAAQKETAGLRRFAPGEPLAQAFEQLCNSPQHFPAQARLQMLELVLRVFESELTANQAEPSNDDSARLRLKILLEEMNPADMLELSFADLATEVACSPRHLSRIFQQVVGTSFRQKQAQIRLGKAQALLTGTKSKVVEVAFQSGYQSLSLFNLMFKRRFGLTPAQWRLRSVKENIAERARL